ncbi:MAG: transcriptional repressor [Firmicutes bacterium]|nr:transcriptional repressor [Bacillota bacterium]
MKRNTVQRQIILDAITQLGNHPTAEMVYSHVVKRHPSIGRATVYRNLSTAASDGEILSVGVLDGAMRFDHNNHAHSHFVCDGCARIIDVPVPCLNEHFASLTDIDITRAELTLRGLCKNCRTA